MLPIASIEQPGFDPVAAPEAASPPSLHQLPPPPGDLTGRKKFIEQIAASVRFDGASIVGLFGMPGIGKTTLGLKLAEELLPRYPDGQIYLNLRGPGDRPLPPLEAMSHVIRSFDPGFPESSLKVDIDGHYRSTLNGRRVIIFLDDATDADQVKHLIPPADCLLIITSWSSLALPGLLAKDVGPLSNDEGRELLLAVAPRLGERADEMATICGGIPAALRRGAGILVEHRDLTVDDCMRRLSRTHDQGALMEESVSTVYKRLNPELRRAWRTLSLFPGRFDAADAAEIWGTNRETAENSLSALLACFLLEWEGSSPGYTMHKLIRLSAQAHCTDAERRSAGKRLAEHSLTIVENADKLYMQGGEALRRGLALFDTQRVNIDAGWGWACMHAGEDETAARLCARIPVAGSNLLDIRQSPADRLSSLEAPLAAARRLGARCEETVILRDIGTAWFNAGDIQRAIENQMQALEASRESGDRTTEAVSEAGLGLAHARNGEFARAVEYHENALALARETHDIRTECHTIAQMARTHRLMGDEQRAMTLSEQALKIAGETGDLCAEARLLGDIAAASLAAGKALRSIEVGGQSLQIASGIGDRVQEESALDTLGKGYSTIGDSRQAIQSHESRLRIARDLHDRYGEGDALGNLGNACARSGDTRRGLAYHEELLSLVRGFGDRRGEATVLGNIGQAQLKLGETRKALESQAARLLIARELGDRRLEGSALWNMSIGLEKLGDRPQAVSHAEAARKIFEADGGEEAVTIHRQLSTWTDDPAHAPGVIPL